MSRPVNATFERYKAQTLPVDSDYVQQTSNLSLAHFIGGNRQVKSPVLTKTRYEEDGREVDSQPVRTFLSTNPEFLQSQRISLPGMTPSVKSRSMDEDLMPATSSAVPTPSPGRAVRSWTDSVAVASSEPKEKAASASLTKLRASNLVKERLQWSQDMEQQRNLPESKYPQKRPSVLETNQFEPQAELNHSNFSPTVDHVTKADNPSSSLHHLTTVPKRSSAIVSPSQTTDSPPSPTQKPSIDSLKNLWTAPISPKPSSPSSPMLSPTKSASRPLPVPQSSKGVALPGMTLPKPAQSSSQDSSAVRHNIPEDDWMPTDTNGSKVADRSQFPETRTSRFSDSNPGAPRDSSTLNMEETSVEDKFASSRKIIPEVSTISENSAIHTATWKRPKRDAPSIDSTSTRIKVPPFKASAISLPDLSFMSVAEDASHLGLSSTSLSVEVFALRTESYATLQESEKHVFYSTEIIFLVQRSKTREGLAKTNLLVWSGHDADAPISKKSQKTEELQRRYQCRTAEVSQGSSLEEEIATLFDYLLIRNGRRDTFDASDTRLYRISAQSSSVISECSVTASSICTGFSYVLAVAGTSVVWNGKYSNQEQKSLASTFAAQLGNRITKAEEENGTRNSLFWQVLGKETAYAQSIIWRQAKKRSQPKIYSIHAFDKQQIRTEAAVMRENVSVLDLGIELYIIVGSDRRGEKADIAFAIAVGEQLVKLQPRPIHVLVFPTIIPIDLLAAYTSSDLRDLNAAYRPSNLSCYTLAEARVQLERTSFSRKEVSDITSLPVGLAADDLS